MPVDFAKAAQAGHRAFARWGVVYYPPGALPVATTPGGRALKGIFNDRFLEVAGDGAEGAVTTFQVALDLLIDDFAPDALPVNGAYVEVAGRRWTILDADTDGVAIVQLKLRKVPAP